MKHQEALDKITKGVRKFQNEIYPSHRAMFEKLRQRQEPIAMFLTCADSRVVPNLITQTEPGEIFVERNPGNIVPHYSDFIGGVSASVEYAMLVLKVPLVIVCGHTDCGVMKAVADPQQASGMPSLQQWMRHSMPAKERLLREHPGASAEERLHLLTQFNVQVQIENLSTHPAVAKRLAASEVELRGWVYDIAHGSINQADPATGRFEPLLP